MCALDPVAGLGQPLTNLFGDHDGAMLAPGAAEGHREIALPFLDVVRQEEEKQIGRLIQELRRSEETAGYIAPLGDACRSAAGTRE